MLLERSLRNYSLKLRALKSHVEVVGKYAVNLGFIVANLICTRVSWLFVFAVR